MGILNANPDNRHIKIAKKGIHPNLNYTMQKITYEIDGKQIITSYIKYHAVS